MNNKPAAGGYLMETIQALTAATLQFSHKLHLRAPTSAIGSRKSAQKSAFLPPFQNQGKWDTLYLWKGRSTHLECPSG
ncbi:MAG: hypothetical protein J6386_19290 [Candidatus Synoicihabitans palmerolidicus]|nr:hypothetical protein [Candidatus Synoicihabitans palmerolidicus]